MYETEGDTVPDIAELTVGIWGLGKMGLPLAAVLADRGATVHGVDIDKDVVSAVNEGECPVENEPVVPELVSRYGGNSLQATTNGAAAAGAVDVAIILVPTILDEDMNPNLAPVIAAGQDIAAGLEPGTLVCLESTVPPGTTAGTLRETLESSGLTAGEEFGLAFCPERTASGSVVKDLTESYPKIVGGIDDASRDAATQFYRQFNEPGVIEADNTTAAEAIKVFEGIYRDVNIALANELGRACEEWGLNSDSVFEAANSQPFCHLHSPGIGVGGHCIPVYPHFVMDRATETDLVETARQINEEMPAHTVAVLEQQLDGHDKTLDGANVLVLGVAYRAGVNEVRYAPAIDTIEILSEHGATVYAHDPVVPDETIAETDATVVTAPSAAEDLDGIVLATGHEIYHDLDMDALAAGMRTPILVDGRRFFDAGEVSGFDSVAIGDGRR